MGVLSFQPDLSLSERNAVFQKFDANLDGSINFGEFCTALQSVNANALVTIESKIKLLEQNFKAQGYNVHQIFSVFDRNNDGFLSRDEWRRAMDILGANLNDIDRDSIFQHFDANNDGYVSLVEFQRFFQDTLARIP